MIAVNSYSYTITAEHKKLKEICGGAMDNFVDERDYKCESRVENQRNNGSSDTGKDMKKETRKRADQRSGLDIGQAG